LQQWLRQGKPVDGSEEPIVNFGKAVTEVRVEFKAGEWSGRGGNPDRDPDATVLLSAILKH
jgi:hypothetical protein